VSFDGSLLVLALPAVAADFHAGVPALANLASLLQVGVVIGLPLAVLSDRLGRRRMLALAVAGFSIADVASAAAPSLLWLALARTLAVAFETVAASVATALVVEESPAAGRGVAVAALTLAGGAGAGLTTIAYPLIAPNWRLLYLAGAAGLVAAAVMAAALPESRAWTASAAEVAPVTRLWRPPWRRRLAVVLAVAALGGLLYDPAGVFVALFASRELGLGPGAISAVYAASGIVAIPAILLGGYLSDRHGRRLPGTCLAALAAISTAVTFSGTRPAFVAGNLAWSGLGSAAGPVISAWFGELFPTRSRASSLGLDAVAGAVGAVAGLQLLSVLEPRVGLGPGILAAGAAALAGAFLLLALPETRGRELPA
jgi:MFS family permease